jgi:hypothetical protein
MASQLHTVIYLKNGRMNMYIWQQVSTLPEQCPEQHSADQPDASTHLEISQQ